MITGLGTDVVNVERVKAALLRHGDKLMEKVLAPGEREQSSRWPVNRQAEFVAGRFAAKEAMAKAAGCGLGRLQMNRVELYVDATGLCVRFLYDHPQPGWVSGRWLVSISHTDQVAFAAAILNEDEPRRDE